MEAIQMQDTDLNFDSSCSTPYITAPSSPHLKTNNNTNNFDDLDGENRKDEDFAFDFSGQLDSKTSVFAEELFHKGQIKPLKLKTLPLLKEVINGGFELDESKSDFDDDPVVFNSAISSPRSPIFTGKEITKSSPDSDFHLQSNNGGFEERKSDFDDDPVRFVSAISSPRSPISQNKKMIEEPFSPKRAKPSDFDPFEETLKTIMSVPLRVSDILNEPDHDKMLVVKKDSFFSLLSISKAYKKMKSSNYRSSENISGGTNGGGFVSKRKILAANELRYTAANRAVTAEDKKRKTFLPYKKGLLGCLGYNPAMHDVSRATGSLTRV